MFILAFTKLFNMVATVRYFFKILISRISMDTRNILFWLLFVPAGFFCFSLSLTYMYSRQVYPFHTMSFYSAVLEGAGRWAVSGLPW